MREDDFRPIEPVGGGSGGSGGVDAGPPGSCGVPGGAGGGCAGTGGTSPAPRSPGEPDASVAPDASVDCGDGAVQGPRGCYAADPTVVTWSEARTRCRQRGAGWDLATITDADENELVLALAGSEAWLGGTDVSAEGEWVWVRDGTPFFSAQAPDASAVYAPWNSGEPNDQNDSDCLRVLTTGLWADWACDGTYAFVCQAPAP